MTETISDKELNQLIRDIAHGSMPDIRHLWSALMELKDRRFMQQREEELHNTPKDTY